MPTFERNLQTRINTICASQFFTCSHHRAQRNFRLPDTRMSFVAAKQIFIKFIYEYQKKKKKIPLRFTKTFETSKTTSTPFL